MSAALPNSNPLIAARVPDVDDTGSCPLARCCEACDGGDDLMVVTAQAPTGVLCLTLCWVCISDAETPRLGLVETVARVLAHCCDHVGIDPDDLTAFGAVPDVPNAPVRGER